MRPSDPSRIVDVLCAYWQTAALTAAIDLGVFRALGSRARTAAQLARACRVERAALTRLCDYLVSLRLLRKRNGQYLAAADAAHFLDAESPDSLAALPRFFNAPAVTGAFAALPATVRGGRTRRQPPPASLWPAFAASTLPLRRLAAKDIAATLARRGYEGGRILDIGAGASPLGIELLQRWPTATLVARDRASVLRAARRHAIDAGVNARVATRAGDIMSAPWGGPFDLVLMVNVLDYFDRAGQRRLLRKARRALRPGGALVLAAPHFDADRRSPPDAVAYDLLLLALGAPGGPSSWRERQRQLLSAGFSVAKRRRGVAMVLAHRG